MAPRVRITHPRPDERFDARTQREEPSAPAVHAEICTGPPVTAVSTAIDQTADLKIDDP